MKCVIILKLWHSQLRSRIDKAQILYKNHFTQNPEGLYYFDEPSFGNGIDLRG